MNTQVIKDKLAAELSALTQRLEQIEKDASKAHSADSEEQAQERENDEVLSEIGHETLHSIQQIKSALKRIDEGEYGTCESCGDAIAPERLMILPETTFCVKCAE